MALVIFLPVNFHRQNKMLSLKIILLLFLCLLPVESVKGIKAIIEARMRKEQQAKVEEEKMRTSKKVNSPNNKTPFTPSKPSIETHILVSPLKLPTTRPSPPLTRPSSPVARSVSPTRRPDVLRVVGTVDKDKPEVLEEPSPHRKLFEPTPQKNSSCVTPDKCLSKSPVPPKSDGSQRTSTAEKDKLNVNHRFLNFTRVEQSIHGISSVYKTLDTHQNIPDSVSALLTQLIGFKSSTGLSDKNHIENVQKPYVISSEEQSSSNKRSIAAKVIESESGSATKSLTPEEIFEGSNVPLSLHLFEDPAIGGGILKLTGTQSAMGTPVIGMSPSTSPRSRNSMPLLERASSPESYLRTSPKSSFQISLASLTPDGTTKLATPGSELSNRQATLNSKKSNTFSSQSSTPRIASQSSDSPHAYILDSPASAPGSNHSSPMATPSSRNEVNYSPMGPSSSIQGRSSSNLPYLIRHYDYYHSEKAGSSPMRSTRTISVSSTPPLVHTPSSASPPYSISLPSARAISTWPPLEQAGSRQSSRASTPHTSPRNNSSRRTPTKKSPAIQEKIHHFESNQKRNSDSPKMSPSPRVTPPNTSKAVKASSHVSGILFEKIPGELRGLVVVPGKEMSHLHNPSPKKSLPFSDSSLSSVNVVKLVEKTERGQNMTPVAAKEESLVVSPSQSSSPLSSPEQSKSDSEESPDKSRPLNRRSSFNLLKRHLKKLQTQGADSILEALSRQPEKVVWKEKSGSTEKETFVKIAKENTTTKENTTAKEKGNVESRIKEKQSDESSLEEIETVENRKKEEENIEFGDKEKEAVVREHEKEEIIRTEKGINVQQGIGIKLGSSTLIQPVKQLDPYFIPPPPPRSLIPRHILKQAVLTSPRSKKSPPAHNRNLSNIPEEIADLSKQAEIGDEASRSKELLTREDVEKLEKTESTKSSKLEQSEDGPIIIKGESSSLDESTSFSKTEGSITEGLVTLTKEFMDSKQNLSRKRMSYTAPSKFTTKQEPKVGVMEISEEAEIFLAFAEDPDTGYKATLLGHADPVHFCIALENRRIGWDTSARAFLKERTKIKTETDAELLKLIDDNVTKLKINVERLEKNYKYFRMESRKKFGDARVEKEEEGGNLFLMLFRLNTAKEFYNSGHLFSTRSQSIKLYHETLQMKRYIKWVEGQLPFNYEKIGLDNAVDKYYKERYLNFKILAVNKSI